MSGGKGEAASAEQDDHPGPERMERQDTVAVMRKGILGGVGQEGQMRHFDIEILPVGGQRFYGTQHLLGPFAGFRV